MIYTSDVICDSIFKTVDRYGYILIHDLPQSAVNEIFKLIENHELIQLDKLPSTKDFMNSSYMATYSDNRFNLFVKDEGNLSKIVKTLG
jgi:hypothetical protein